MIKKILIILIISLSACGYTPINTTQKFEIIKYSEIEFKGNKELTDALKKKLIIAEDKNNLNLNKLKINANYNTIETSRNSKGQSSTFKSSILIELSKYEKDKLVKKLNFVEEFNYEKKNNQYLQNIYEEEIKQDLLRKIIDKINLSIQIQ